MNITLRKANAIQGSIMEAISSIEITTTVDINEFQDAKTVIEKANETLFANDSRRQALLLAYYNIRGLVGAANSQSGVDVALTKAAFIDKRIAQLAGITNAAAIKDLAIVEGQLEKIRNAPADSRHRLYGEDVVRTSVVGQEQIDQARAEIRNLKKQKQKINDEVLELNIKTEIPLGDEVVATLTNEGLI